MARSGDSDEQFSLNRLLVMLLLVFLCERVFTNIPRAWLPWKSPEGSDFYATQRYLYLSTALFVVLEMLVVMCFYRPLSMTFSHRPRPRHESDGVRWNIFAGIGAGIAGSVLSVPFLAGRHATVTLYAVFPKGLVGDVRSVGYFALLGLILPTATTIVFAGCVLGTLLAHAKPVPSMLAVAALMAYLFPVFTNFVIAAVSGMVLGFAYWRRGLPSAIVANIVMSALGILYGLWSMRC